jgi:hypothetical protein
LTAYAALKGRSSTVIHAFGDPGTWRSRHSVIQEIQAFGDPCSR